MTATLAAWLVEVVLVTYRNTKSGAADNAAGLPLPADYLAVWAMFGALSLVPAGSSASKFTGALAWALVIATYMNLVPGIKKPVTSTTSVNPNESTVPPVWAGA